MPDPVLDIFREEAREHLSALEKGVLDLESAASPEVAKPLIDMLFRHAHSLKGDSRAIGLTGLQEVAQKLEDLLDDLRENPEQIQADSITHAFHYIDQVRNVFDSWQRSSQMEIREEDIEETNQEGPSPAASSFSAPSASTTPEKEETFPAPIPPEKPAVPGTLGEESFTVRVPSDRLDRMLNLAGEIRIGQRSTAVIQHQLELLSAQLEQSTVGETEILSELKLQLSEWQSHILDQLHRIREELRRQTVRQQLLGESLEIHIRQARLLPLSMLTDSLRRPVRDLAKSLKKQIAYQADVGKVLLDKAVIEALKEPMLHLIRNAVDHGIESPEERKAAGKSEVGTIRVAATQRGEQVRITLSDDGRGINYSQIRETLRRKRKYEDAELEQLTDMELARHLFNPGFTTAALGEVSGRGVGLDVVQDIAQKLQGRVEVISHPPNGSSETSLPSMLTTFVIGVPVTVSIIRVLTVVANGRYYGIPSNIIDRIGHVRLHQLKELKGNPVLLLNGQPIRWIHLTDLLGGSEVPKRDQTSLYPYLLVKHEGQLIAVAVDDLEDEMEVLLKPLGYPLTGVPGIIGGSIRPNGDVQVVLDLSVSAFELRTKKAVIPPLPTTSQSAGRLLVVDDSPTTRTILRNVFVAAGYQVWTATDGIHALEQLRIHPVDLIVSDVEMPRLNGVDLTRQVKAKFGLPVILVTGREKEEHRREGLEAGADAYIVKSTFEGEGLLDILRQFF